MLALRRASVWFVTGPAWSARKHACGLWSAGLTAKRFSVIVLHSCSVPVGSTTELTATV
jgi:hypothetical protein